MQPQQLVSICVFGEEGAGKKTLVSTLNGCVYTRCHDQRSFVLSVQIGTTPIPLVNPASLTVILVDATDPFKISPWTVQGAMESAASFCVILFTKIDLFAHDYSSVHISYLHQMRTLASLYNLDCLSASINSKDGVSDLMKYIVNTLAPLPQPRNFDLYTYLKQIQSFFLNCISVCFALPTKQMTSNVDDELAAVTSDDDIRRLFKGATSTAWCESLRHRFGLEQDAFVPTKRITPSLVVKWLSSSERISMEYARRHSSIPIPRVHLPHSSLLVMDFIDGQMLSECWHKLSRLMQFRVACTLRLYVNQLRSLKSPTVGGVDDGHVTGAFFEFNEYGPFETVKHFQKFCDEVSFSGWRSTALTMQYYGETPSPLPESSTDWTPVFTHGDINLTNVLLDKQGTLWLIDWATAGFYPACVESLAMLRCNQIHDLSSSWERYRWFIVGTVQEEEEKYWFNIEGAIHRFRAISM